jgi:hypothetical protein
MAGAMLPRFDASLALDDARQTVTASGPFALAGNEDDAYLWMRISQKRGRSEVDAVGTLEIDKRALRKEFRDANRRLSAAVKAAVDGAAGLPPAQRARRVRDETEAAVATQGPKWSAPVTIEGTKQFRTGTAMAEAWLLVRTDEDPPGEFHTYWKTAVTLVSQDAL